MILTKFFNNSFDFAFVDFDVVLRDSVYIREFLKHRHNIGVEVLIIFGFGALLVLLYFGLFSPIMCVQIL